MTQPTAEMERTAEQFAKAIAEFITWNQIDTKQISMDEIVKGYFIVQMKANEEAGRRVFESMNQLGAYPG